MGLNLCVSLFIFYPALKGEISFFFHFFPFSLKPSPPIPAIFLLKKTNKVGYGESNTSVIINPFLPKKK